MQPYQEAAETTRRSGEGSISALKYAGTAALGAAGAKAASSIISRVAPLLSQYIPQEFAKKGLSKVDPRFGKFIDKAEDEGFDFDEIRDFIGEKIEKSAKQKLENKSSSQPNLIGQASPELQSFIEQQIQAGKAPDHAAALAMPRAEFSDIVRKIEKQSGKRFTALVRDLYDGKAIEQPESKAASQGQQPQQPQQGLDPGVAQILQQGQALLQKFQGR